jgi:hypothetical protein
MLHVFSATVPESFKVEALSPSLSFKPDCLHRMDW